ncbi:MAG: hypothetical protein ACREC1_01305 [Methylovirgula sp.]
MSADSSRESPLHLGPFTVRIETEASEAFGRATGGRAGGVPFTFPVRWLAHPDIRAAAARLIGEAEWVPIHESQSFDVRRSLETAVDYRMRIEMWREAKPPRLLLHAEVATDAGELCLAMEMMLRIVSTVSDGGAVQ